MAVYFKNKDGKMYKVSGGGGGLATVPIATSEIIGGIKSSNSTREVSVNDQGIATVNDVVTMEGGGVIVYSGATGPGPHTIVFNDEPPSASAITFDNTGTGLSATTMQGAIEELAQKLSGGGVIDLPFTPGPNYNYDAGAILKQCGAFVYGYMTLRPKSAISSSANTVLINIEHYLIGTITGTRVNTSGGDRPVTLVTTKNGNVTMWQEPTLQRVILSIFGVFAN